MCSHAYGIHLTIPGLAGLAAQVEVCIIQFGIVTACKVACSVCSTKHVLKDSLCSKQNIT